MLRTVLTLLAVVLGGCEIMLDLSYDLAPESARYPLFARFNKSTTFKEYIRDGIWLEAYHLEFSEHTSTHMDAPNHFAKGLRSIDKIPFENLVAPAVVIDISAKAARYANAMLSADDVLAWVEEHGPVPERGLVFLRTGWGRRYGNDLLYMGTDTNDTTKLASPGFSEEAIKVLASFNNDTGRGIVGVGIDALSLDPGNSQDFKAHLELLGRNLYGIENVANLEKLPTTGAEVTVLPLKVRAGSGGPCRILARIPGNSAGPGASPAAALLLLLGGWGVLRGL